ncbi:MAG TPA: hypothetical protein VK469_20105, partial [Candidatus Kapabacteria bacterium]|nr:hypothetical protein [Candidatus Kapabacteria bacterium]
MKKFKSKTKVGLISIPEVLDSNNDLDWEFLEKVEKVAVKCFKNSRYEEVYHLHNEWNNHVENILGYIALFCSETKFNLNKHELTIIVAASILHDIGKGIPYLHPSIDNKKINEDAFVLKNLEGAHHVISFIVLNKIINKEQPFENLLPDDEKQKESYNKLNELISNFQFSDDQRKYLQCAAWITLRHKKISDDLLYIFDVYLPKPKNDCSKEDAAKKKGNFLENDVKDNDQIKEINVWLNENNSKTASGNDSPDRFSVLSALLQLGDKLDITKERIREERLYLEVLLNDLVGNEVERKIHFQKQHLIEPQSLARWYQYFYVKDIDIKEKQRGDNKENSSNMKDNEKGLDITIHYTYPECIRDEFLFIRSQLEKDFEDLGILSVLERALQEEKKDEDYRITIYRSENRKEGENNDKKPQRITGLQRRSERLVYCLRKICESNNAGYDFYKEYITKKLQDCLRLADTDIKAIFECMDRKTGNPHPENCELFKAVKKFFQKDDEKSSHPDLENISIKLPENIRYLFCPDESQENEKITNYREKIEKEAILSLSPQALVGLKELKEEATKKIKKEVPGKLFYTP